MLWLNTIRSGLGGSLKNNAISGYRSRDEGGKGSSSSLLESISRQVSKKAPWALEERDKIDLHLIL